jgi:acetoin utilization deacetylase AcuC-like enzyme
VIAHPERPVPFTPKVQKLMQHQSDDEIKDADKSDTTFSAGSLQAALRAAGSVIAAIDAVIDGTHRNAFCCVRPPGHHAGANGLESDAVSCGFCIFNNVAIGALHALREHSSAVKKVAVIDFDVHHGNGTQAILEGIDDPSAVFFFSIHLCEFDFPLATHVSHPANTPRRLVILVRTNRYFDAGGDEHDARVH